MKTIYPAERGILITLCCPNPPCGKRVAVMDHYPVLGQPIEPKDITLVDGRTPKDPESLVCSHCFAVFPPRKAKVPAWLLAKGTEELEKRDDRTEGKPVFSE